MSTRIVVCAVALLAIRAPFAAETLDADFLLGDAVFDLPVHMSEFAEPPDAGPPRHRFSGSLSLIAADESGRLRVVHDAWARHEEFGAALQELPASDLRFVQRGRDLVPLTRGVQRSEHPYWEMILQPGRVWHAPRDGDWSRAAVPFALQERAANCTHNGVLTWLFNDAGVSRVAYQISSETCGYFKFDAWGAPQAEYRIDDPGEAARAAIEQLDRHRAARLPAKPLALLWDDRPGLERRRFGVDDGIDPADITVLGMVVDGVHYRSGCATRAGPHPFCASLPLPSYSTAKSIFAAVAAMRLQKLHDGLLQSSIADLVGPPCDSGRWGDVTIGHALDMATGNYRDAGHEVDENSLPHRRFLFLGDHRSRLEFACSHFPRNAKPGTRFVYHSSDTYLVGTALANFVARQGDHDLYRDVLVDTLWRPLALSPLLDDSRRTYDHEAQPYTGYGLTYEADDIARIALWLARDGGRIAGEPMLDETMLAATLQRSADDRGVDTGLENLGYNNGFWSFDASDLLGCAGAVRVPFMSGVSGITVAMFPNGIVYYYFSDSYMFRWGSAIRTAHEIRSLCT